jgi:hypothetical protein
MKVLVATKERQVFDLLNAATGVEAIAALDTRRIYEAIPDTQLAIVDYDDLIEQPFSRDFIRKLLALASSPDVGRLQECNSAEFIASPQTYLKANIPVRPSYQLPPKRTIVFTSYSGGTGRTSLSLDTALEFVAQTKKRQFQLPAAVLEFTYGHSALTALVGEMRPSLFELISQPEIEPPQFQGVTLYPMDYDTVRSLPSEQVERYYRQQIAHHVLTVIDTTWPQSYVVALGNIVDLWIVLTTPRVDAVENARKLYHDLALEYGEDKVRIAVNQMGGLAASLALMGLRRDLVIPRVPQGATFFEGRLGREVLRHVYDSVWKEYETGSKRRGRLLKRQR